jgi:xylan 1,4-beta-xylosidase
VAEGGTVFTHQEVVARSSSLEADSFETDPHGPFLTNYDTPHSYLQKQGHGALVSTPSGEWYYASLCARPLHRENESVTNPRGWSTLGRETAIQKVEWDSEDWPRIVGGHGGQTSVEAPKDAAPTEVLSSRSHYDDFSEKQLNKNWQTLRVPFSAEMGSVGDEKLELIGKGSLTNRHDLSMIARRWQTFYFDATTKVKFDPFSYQQMAGLTNYYNDQHWSFIFITWNEENGKVIEVAENNQGTYTSYLRENAITIPDDVDFVWFKTKVRKQTYRYAYSFDGETWHDLPIEFDSAILSDDYVLQTCGGFFTGAFVGLAAVDYAGYDTKAVFYEFDYREMDEEGRS